MKFDGFAQGKKIVGCKWVSTTKVNPVDSIARLVAKRYTQTYGVDYLDTIYHIAKLTFVCLFISLVIFMNWSSHNWISKMCFFMVISHDFVAPVEYRKACYLKSLYGLKQGPRAWFDKFSELVQNFKMKIRKYDHSVFSQ